MAELNLLHGGNSRKVGFSRTYTLNLTSTGVLLPVCSHFCCWMRRVKWRKVRFCKASLKFRLMRQASLFMCDWITNTLLPPYTTVLHYTVFSLIEDCALPLLNVFAFSLFNFLWYYHGSSAPHQCFNVIFSSLPVQMDRKGREKWRSDKQQSIQFLLGGRCPSCLLTASHNNSSQCKCEGSLRMRTHTHKHTHGTFKLITQLLLQLPTSHLVQWFGSAAFYKRRPEEHGEQVLHTHTQWQLQEA